jgi:hypothetical protein
MECPECGATLEIGSDYGYLGSHQSGEVLGHTYKCINSDGFETEEEALAFMEKYDETFESLGVTSWEEVVCYSSEFGGRYYTNKQDHLIEGYPC